MISIQWDVRYIPASIESGVGYTAWVVVATVVVAQVVLVGKLVNVEATETCRREPRYRPCNAGRASLSLYND